MFVVVRAYETAKKKLSRQEAMAEATDPLVLAQQELIESLNRLNTTVSQRN